MFLISVSDNLPIKKVPNTFDTQISSIVSYHYYIVLDRNTLFITYYFKDLAARKGIKLDPSTCYYPQMYA